jgi:hypothetical protein
MGNGLFLLYFPVRLVEEEMPAASHLISQAKVEKINIEFSDIYSFD